MLVDDCTPGQSNSILLPFLQNSDVSAARRRANARARDARRSRFEPAGAKLRRTERSRQHARHFAPSARGGDDGCRTKTAFARADSHVRLERRRRAPSGLEAARAHLPKAPGRALPRRSLPRFRLFLQHPIPMFPPSGGIQGRLRRCHCALHLSRARHRRSTRIPPRA
jgi:hypothetical protein